jgi:ABC-2 type transport system ATP-binding protein
VSTGEPDPGLPGGGSPAALSVRGLRKAFGSKVAVDGIDLDIPHGCFFGLVGPNGAGKTTTLGMVTGLLRPDAGLVLIDGVEVWRDPVTAKRRIGVLPEDLRLFDRLTGAELLTYNGLLRGMAPQVVEARAKELLDVLGLADAAGTLVVDYSHGMRKKIALASALLHAPRVLFLDEPFEAIDPVSARTIRGLLEVLGLADAAGTLVVDYSHGMRKKIALAAALLHAPRVLFLDEPFEAIDPVSARTIRGLLERYTAGGATVVFSSHVMELVERLCDRVGIMHLGRLIAEGPTDQVRAGRSLEDAFVDLVGASHAGAEELGWLGTWSA